MLVRLGPVIEQWDWWRAGGTTSDRDPWTGFGGWLWWSAHRLLVQIYSTDTCATTGVTPLLAALTLFAAGMLPMVCREHRALCSLGIMGCAVHADRDWWRIPNAGPR